MAFLMYLRSTRHSCLQKPIPLMVLVSTIGLEDSEESRSSQVRSNFNEAKSSPHISKYIIPDNVKTLLWSLLLHSQNYNNRRCSVTLKRLRCFDITFRQNKSPEMVSHAGIQRISVVLQPPKHTIFSIYHIIIQIHFQSATPLFLDQHWQFKSINWPFFFSSSLVLTVYLKTC